MSYPTYSDLELEIQQLEEENKKLKEERDNCLKEVKLCYNDIHGLEGQISDLEEENKKLKETIKDHQLYEEKLEHRIIEFEELLHGE